MIAVLIAGAVATLISLFGTRYLIVLFRTRGHGQPILGKEDHDLWLDPAVQGKERLTPLLKPYPDEEIDDADTPLAIDGLDVCLCLSAGHYTPTA